MAMKKVQKPIEKAAFRVWPAMVVFLWASILATRGVLGYNGTLFICTAVAAMLSSFAHILFPYRQDVRYVALSVNLLAMISRSLDYVFAGYGWRIALAGFAIWITIAVAKITIFLLSAAVVEITVARKELASG